MKKISDFQIYQMSAEKNCNHPNLIIALRGDKVCVVCGRVVYSKKFQPAPIGKLQIVF